MFRKLFEKFLEFKRKRKIHSGIKKANRYECGRKIESTNEEIHEFYNLIIAYYIKEEKIKEFKENSGNGTDPWFIKFAGDMLLFKNNDLTSIPGSFKFSTGYNNVEKDFILKKVNEIIPKEFFISRILNTQKEVFRTQDVTKEYTNLLQILNSCYNLDHTVLDHLLEIRGLFRKDFNTSGLKLSDLEYIINEFDNRIIYKCLHP